MPSIERDIAGGQTISSSNLSFGMAGMSLRDFEKKKQNALRRASKSPENYAIEKEKEVGVLKRNKLLLEHVMV